MSGGGGGDYGGGGGGGGDYSGTDWTVYGHLCWVGKS